MTFTFFPGLEPMSRQERRRTLSELRRELKATKAKSKIDLALFTGAVFGDRRSSKGILRHNANVEGLDALVVDYDENKAGGVVITPDRAADLCEDADVAVLIATTPSHGTPEKGNCWRAIFPLSSRRSPAEHAALWSMANRLFRGGLDKGAKGLSQSFYFGHVGKIWTAQIDGRSLDEADELAGGDEFDHPRVSDGSKADLEWSDFEAAVMHIPNDDASFEDWLATGMAIHHQGDDAPEALELFHRWSERSGKYEPGDLDRRWDSFGRYSGNVVTGRTIVFRAKKHGWEDPARASELARMLALMPDITDPAILNLKPLGAYALDENGVINAFTDRHAGELKFDHDAGRWFVFVNGLWREERTKLALAYARNLSTELAKRDAKVKALNKVSSWEAVERGARSVREFKATSGDWNRDPLLLGTPGGVVDLQTGKLRPGLSEDMISRSTAAAPIPLDVFDPERDCPLWLGFLNEALDGDADAIRLIQQWGGYCLTGDTREEKLVFVYGPGGSGKSTTVETIGKLMGDYATTIATEAFKATKFDRHPTEIAALRGARMVWASETEKGQQWAENRIKQWTGGDTLKARFMRQDEFTFVPEFKLSVVGNNRPTLKDVDTAMTRRLLVIPFDHPPARKDAALKDKLKAEWPGILAWLIRGCLDWQHHGLVRPAIVDKATDEYFAAQDVFGRWLEDCCEIDRGFAETTAVLWDSWARYAHDEGVEPGSKTATFPETLSQRGFTAASKVGRSRGRGYKGLRLRDDNHYGTGRDR
ncbi:P4 family phage/plasmid primase-like protein [Methylopila capsulata]|uniref:P4 family phage/plasmid primase-like protein n=1 Tax=Methylopila capsulata TaxID=61654 RepID=A0A9W6MQN4_9HYPH|nr:phage/plasmid primase, P4 family [Methylopila capsulata]MBM7851344.1 P4 family phage/plasmid primase-like protein [Methylopila capsulata]GLK54402.1 hypothetical protein GCM10008170_04210 [Methylopila capsulata]